MNTKNWNITTLLLAFVMMFAFSLNAQNERPIEPSPEKMKTDQTMSQDQDKVYDITEVDTKPLFSNDCVTDANPATCSEKKVNEYFKELGIAADKTNAGANANPQQVHFVVSSTGEVSKVKYKGSADKACETCQAEAEKLFASMPAWVPATKDNQPVSVKMSVPVHLEKAKM